MSRAVRLFACLALAAAAPDARAGFITYAFTSDTSGNGGSLAGSFRVDEADLADGILSTGDIQNYLFTFTDPTGATALYTLNSVLPDLPVDPATGIPLPPPLGFDGFVLGDQIGGGDGIVQVALTSEALTPDASFWFASNRPNDESEEADGGFGHWVIAPEDANPVPAPAGAILGLIGAGCLAFGRRLRRE
jgi:hypothetical protein